MWPNSPYAHPISSFERPVPLVLIDPCAEPTVTVRINREWIPYLLGAAKQLVLQSTWDTSDPEALQLVQQRAMGLLACIADALNNPDCECGCKDYTPSEDFITWAPQNPYTQPDLVPPYYVFPPWVVLGASVPFTGLQAGDVVTTLLRAPTDAVFAGGFPRFRINVTDAGTVELTLLRFPTASLALISVDDNPATLQYTDLNIGLDAALGTPLALEVVPVQVVGPGPHYIDVTIVPSVGAVPPYINFGGGIRQIAFCGFTKTPDALPLIQYANLMEYPMPICNDLRFNNGKLQGLCCFNPDTGLMEWEDIRGQDGGTINDTAVTPDGTSKPAAGDSTCYNVQLSASSIYQFPWPVSNGDTITISQIKGAWTDGAGHWYCSDGTPYVLNLCVGVAGHAMGDPSGTAWHMQLVAFDGTTYYPVLDGVPFTISGLSDPQMLTIFANDAPRSDNAGTISFKVCGTNNATPPVTTWCRDFPFTYGDKLTWHEQGTTTWTGTAFQKDSGHCDMEVVMDTTKYAGSIITKIVVYMGVYSGGSAYMRIGYVDGSGPHNIDLPQAPVIEYTMPDVTITGGSLELVGDECGVTSETVTRITVYGTGTPPTAGLGC